MSEQEAEARRARRGVLAGVAAFAFALAAVWVLAQVIYGRARVSDTFQAVAILWVFAGAPLIALAAYGAVGFGREGLLKRWLAFTYRPSGGVAWAAALLGPPVLVAGMAIGFGALGDGGTRRAARPFALLPVIGLFATVLGVGGLLTDALIRREGEGSGRDAAESGPAGPSAMAGREAISFTCPHCRRANRVPLAYAGTAGRCPGCKQPVDVPKH